MAPTAPFPLYLLPSIPFRRRSSTQSTSTISTSPTSPSSSPPAPTSFLTSSPTTNLRCTKCLADLVPTASIISKGFTGRHGRAYLVAPPPPSALLYLPNAASSSDEDPASWRRTDLPNTFTHRPVARQLVTGAHTVSDISCSCCGSVLGWKYVHAEEEGQRYKIGKFILETKRVSKSGNEWQDEDEEYSTTNIFSEDDVQFDSQDEEECEDLFSGIWTPELARKRRKNKDFRP
ncbi:yippee-domain-containing protein [Didymella exigua CBS 183.55]|uniref:Yippee-domain-containing protein n=1 Tax=Didymella exigua CBS 183.55 TaxID=1150837 RepID=A0A6A5RFB3_9PLEO|nr:yippee-domain-containing protein [Didymella exigua CBS 183.55]KAF1925868.1 yippee-domain-containing protein [Didymella exigua CBS 183.55]